MSTNSENESQDYRSNNYGVLHGYNVYGICVEIS